MDVELERCHSMGDGLHEYGRCIHELFHDENHEDEEGNQWYS